MTEGTVNLFIEIGNSNDKLPQKKWRSFWLDVNDIVDAYKVNIFGRYVSESNSQYQNACWHFEIEGQYFNDVERELGSLCKIYNQSSIALTQGDTVFVTQTTLSERLENQNRRQPSPVTQISDDVKTIPQAD